MAQPDTIDTAACERMIRTVADTCERGQAVAQSAPIDSAKPDFDALAAAITAQGSSIAAQASFLTFGSILLAVLAIAGAIAWGVIVRRWALDEARKTAEDWMDRHALEEITKIATPILGGAINTPEQQAKGLSEDTPPGA